MSILRRVELHETKAGIRILSGDVQLAEMLINNSSANCLEIAGTSSQSFDLEGSRFTGCAESNILVTADGHIGIRNVTIDSGSTGVKVDSAYGHFSLQHSVIQHMTSFAVDIFYSSYSSSGNLTLLDCDINSCADGIRYRSNNVYGDVITANIHDNHLTKVKNNALVVDVPSYRWSGTRDRDAVRNVDISRNTFDDVCGIFLLTRMDVNLTFHDNAVLNCQCLHYGDCLVTAWADTGAFALNRTFDVSTNLFGNNTAQCIIRLQSFRNDIAFDGTFLYNQLFDNDVANGVVHVSSLHFIVSGNLFDNPASTYDVYGDAIGKLHSPCASYVLNTTQD